MACGCRKKASVGQYRVFLNGNFTGRAFASLSDAQAYANRIGGEVRTS